MKRTKAPKDDHRDFSSVTKAEVVRDLQLQEEVPGKADAAPLCISVDGSRAWARMRPEPYSLLYVDLCTHAPVWAQPQVPITAGAWVSCCFVFCLHNHVKKGTDLCFGG